jgi:hypothetical protein
MGFMRGYNLAAGIACIVLGAGLLAMALLLPVAALGLGIGAVGCFVSGGFCIWWHVITKDTVMAARPVGLGAGMAQMANGTAQANAMLAGMVAQNSGAVATTINGQAVHAPSTGMTGTPARATVRQVRDSNAIVAGQPVSDIVLTVTGTQYAPYEVTVKQVLSPVARAQLRPNADVPVRVDPTDPHAVTLALTAM